jgi:hypothetical protein
MQWLLGCGSLLAVALIRFIVPARLEARSRPHQSRTPVVAGRCRSACALVGRVALLLGGLWKRRKRLDVALTRRPWSARTGAFVAGLGVGVLVGSVFAFLWWWAIGAALLPGTLLVAAVVAARE